MAAYLLGDFVRSKRKEMGMSLRDFGKLCDISHTTIDVIERGYDPRTGKSINITDTTYEKLSLGLGVPMAHLVAMSKGVTDGSPSPDDMKLLKMYHEADEKTKSAIRTLLEL